MMYNKAKTIGFLRYHSMGCKVTDAEVINPAGGTIKGTRVTHNEFYNAKDYYSYLLTDTTAYYCYYTLGNQSAVVKFDDNVNYDLPERIEPVDHDDYEVWDGWEANMC